MKTPEKIQSMCAIEFCNKLGKFSSVNNNHHTRDKKRVLNNFNKVFEQLDRLGFKIEITPK